MRYNKRAAPVRCACVAIARDDVVTRTPRRPLAVKKTGANKRCPNGVTVIFYFFFEMTGARHVRKSRMRCETVLYPTADIHLPSAARVGHTGVRVRLSARYNARRCYQTYDNIVSPGNSMTDESAAFERATSWQATRPRSGNFKSRLVFFPYRSTTIYVIQFMVIQLLNDTFIRQITT